MAHRVDHSRVNQSQSVNGLMMTVTHCRSCQSSHETVATAEWMTQRPTSNTHH